MLKHSSKWKWKIVYTSTCRYETVFTRMFCEHQNMNLASVDHFTKIKLQTGTGNYTRSLLSENRKA